MIASEASHVDANAHALVANVMIKYVRSVLKGLVNDVIKGFHQVEENKGTRL